MIRKITFFIVAALTISACCDKDFIIPDYDYFEYAIDVSDQLGGSCDANPIYTTVGATPDRSDEIACLGNFTPLHNRWFKFYMEEGWTDISISIRIEEGYGTQRRTMLALWERDGTTLLDCERYYEEDYSVYLYQGGLEEEQWYYFSVDTESSEDAGTFTVCLDYGD